MTPLLHYFSNSLLPGVADHLWQSTLFAVAVALLTLALRKQSAQVRYIIWLAASLKFLLPFTLLSAIGSRLSPAHTPAPGNTGINFIEEFAQPFTQPLAPTHTAVIAGTDSPTPLHWQTLLLITWLCGAVAVLLIWLARWLKVSAARRNATPLQESREASAMQRLTAVVGTTNKLKLLLSPTSLEPGVFGIFRPIGINESVVPSEQRCELGRCFLVYS